MKVRVEWTLIEGYSDAPTNRLAESVARVYELPAVPRKGDYVDTGRGQETVETVFWPMDDSPPLLQLRRGYTLAESMDDVLASLEAHGWKR